MNISTKKLNTIGTIFFNRLRIPEWVGNFHIHVIKNTLHNTVLNSYQIN